MTLSVQKNSLVYSGAATFEGERVGFSLLKIMLVLALVAVSLTVKVARILRGHFFTEAIQFKMPENSPLKCQGGFEAWRILHNSPLYLHCDYIYDRWRLLRFQRMKARTIAFSCGFQRTDKQAAVFKT